MLTLHRLFDIEGVDPEKVLLIRHNMGDPGAKAAILAGLTQEYTSLQSRAEFAKAERDGRDLWMTFIKTDDGETRLHRVYKLAGQSRPVDLGALPEGYPQECTPSEGDLYYPLEHSGLMADYEGRLTVDWPPDRNYIRIAERDANDFTVTSISPERFPSYDSFITDNATLARMCDDPARYGEWIRALSSVHAIYLILEPVSGGLYVGSATGENGLWGRWNAYAKDGHGGNAILKRLLAEHPERRSQLQYSILRILDHNVSRDDAVKIESTYKRKLGSHAVELHEDEPDYRRLNAN